MDKSEVIEALLPRRMRSALKTVAACALVLAVWLAPEWSASQFLHWTEAEAAVVTERLENVLLPVFDDIGTPRAEKQKSREHRRLREQ